MNRYCLLLVAFAALAQQRETPPPVGPPKPFTVPAKQTAKLSNGMRYTLVSYGSLPTVVVSARVGFGNAHESESQVWLADLAAALLSEGAGKRDATQLAEEAARMGGELQIGAGPDQTSVSIEVLSEFAADAVRLIADVLQRPTFPASELERVRANLLRRRAVSLSTPQGVANEAFAKALYGDHPYGRMFPTESQLKGYTLEQVRKFYADNAGAARTHLFVAGRFDPALKKTIAAAFESWPAGPPVRNKPPSVTPRKTSLLVDRPGAAQSTLRMGLVVPANPAHADYIPMLVANTLLGGSFGSRITRNIREQKGYTYSPFSMVATRYHTAHWVEQADVSTNVTAESIKEILGEIERLRKEAPPESELKGVQKYMGGIFVLQNSSPQGIVNQLTFVDLQGLSDDYLRTYVQKVGAVSQAEIQRIAESYLDPAKMTLVVVGDKAKIEESLKPYR